MIVELLNQNGVGKTTLAIRLVGNWAPRGKPVTLIDADTQGSALDRSQHRRRAGSPRLFGTIGLVRDTQHREAPELARCVDHIIIDGLPRDACLMRSALLAADLMMISVQPSVLDGWVSDDMLALVDVAPVYWTELVARFVLNHCDVRTIFARETAEPLADCHPQVHATTIGQRVIFADAAQSGRLAAETDIDGPLVSEIAALADKMDRLGVERIAP
jgi:chromosome partitioning protein